MAVRTRGADAPEQVLLARAQDVLGTVAADPTTTRILDAALAEFEEFGIRRASIEDIAARAGVARVTVYRRYDSKSALAEAVWTREAHRFFAYFVTAVADVPTLTDMIVEGFLLTLHHLRDHRLWQRLITAEPETVLPYLTVGNGPLLAAGRTLIAGALRAHPDVPRDVAAAPDATAETVLRLVTSFVAAPDTCIDLADDAQARAYARHHLAPIVTRRHP